MGVEDNHRARGVREFTTENPFAGQAIHDSGTQQRALIRIANKLLCRDGPMGQGGEPAQRMAWRWLASVIRVSCASCREGAFGNGILYFLQTDGIDGQRIQLAPQRRQPPRGAPERIAKDIDRQ